MLQRVGMREGGEPLPLAFQHLIFLLWWPCGLNLVLISSLASKCQHFKLRGLSFHYIKWLKKGIPTLKCWHFEAKLKSQGLFIIRIKYWNLGLTPLFGGRRGFMPAQLKNKYWNASGSGFPPSLISSLWNIGILLHKQATRIKHFCPECIANIFLHSIFSWLHGIRMVFLQ